MFSVLSEKREEGGLLLRNGACVRVQSEKPKCYAVRMTDRSTCITCSASRRTWYWSFHRRVGCLRK